jgi:endo-1,4-beta-xylanase
MNDYNIIEYADQNTNFINIVKAIQAAGAPIDAVGVQAHALTDLGGQPITQQSIATKTASVKAMLDKIASETGLPIYVSEYDIDIQNDEQQQWFMEANFTMFWDDPAVKGITLWGYITGATWRNNTGLMSSSGQQRPAMMWLMNFLQTHQ